MSFSGCSFYDSELFSDSDILNKKSNFSKEDCCKSACKDSCEAGSAVKSKELSAAKVSEQIFEQLRQEQEPYADQIAEFIKELSLEEAQSSDLEVSAAKMQELAFGAALMPGDTVKKQEKSQAKKDALEKEFLNICFKCKEALQSTSDFKIPQLSIQDLQEKAEALREKTKDDIDFYCALGKKINLQTYIGTLEEKEAAKKSLLEFLESEQFVHFCEALYAIFSLLEEQDYCLGAQEQKPISIKEFRFLMDFLEHKGFYGVAKRQICCWSGTRANEKAKKSALVNDGQVPLIAFLHAFGRAYKIESVAFLASSAHFVQSSDPEAPVVLFTSAQKFKEKAGLTPGNFFYQTEWTIITQSGRKVKVSRCDDIAKYDEFLQTYDSASYVEGQSDAWDSPKRLSDLDDIPLHRRCAYPGFGPEHEHEDSDPKIFQPKNKMVTGKALKKFEKGAARPKTTLGIIKKFIWFLKPESKLSPSSVKRRRKLRKSLMDMQKASAAAGPVAAGPVYSPSSSSESSPVKPTIGRRITLKQKALIEKAVKKVVGARSAKERAAGSSNDASEEASPLKFRGSHSSSTEQSPPKFTFSPSASLEETTGSIAKEPCNLSTDPSKVERTLEEPLAATSDGVLDTTAASQADTSLASALETSLNLQTPPNIPSPAEKKTARRSLAF